MFGTKKNNEEYSDYSNSYTGYNNNQYSDFNEGNYNQYGSNVNNTNNVNNTYNNYQQGYNNNYQNDYSNDNYQNDYKQNAYQNNNYVQSGYQNSNYDNEYSSDNSYQNDSYVNNYNSYQNSTYPDNAYQNNTYQDTTYQNNTYPEDEYEEDEYEEESYQEDEYEEDTYQDNEYDTQSYSGNTETFDTSYDNNSYSVSESVTTTENFQTEEYYSDGNYTVNPIQPGNSHAMLGKVIAMVSVCVVGLICGSLTDTTLKNFWMQNIESDSMILEAGKVLAIIVYTYAVTIAHILLHEFGHLIGGSVTEYSSVSFRIFGLTFVKDGIKTRVKKYSVPGTAGECTMMPPEINNGKYPFMLYNLGGIIMNLIVSLIVLVMLTKLSFVKVYPFNMMCVIFVVIGIVTIIYNGVPLILNGIPNDGYTIMHMVRSKDARIAVHSHLLINAYLARGGRYSDIPFEQFYMNAGGDYSGHLWVKVKLMEYRWHLEHMDFAKAAECLNSLDYGYKKLPRVFQYEINSEKLFLEMMGNNNQEVVDRLYSPDIKNYLEDSIGMMSSIRIKMAYEACVAGNLKTANKYYNLLKNTAKSEPLKGESDLELMLGMYIFERFCSIQ